MAGSTYILSTFNGTGSSTGAKSTHSVWIKRCDPEFWTDSTARSSIVSGKTNASNYIKTRFADNDAFHVYGISGGSANINLYSSIQCRDVGAWYHLCLQIDTTHATEAERIKIFINGVEGTYSGTYPAQNDTNHLTSSNATIIGGNQDGDEEFDGYMSHFHCIDGTIYPPTAFAETDATSGEWKPITEPSVTYGSKGYFIFKDGAGITDQSGNSNNFQLEAGTLTPTEDNPSNVFATLNPLAASSAALTLKNGNTCSSGPNSNNYWQSVPSTLGATKGKFYWEFKDENSWGGTGDSTRRYGICDLDTIVNTLSSGADVRFSGSTSGYAYMNASGVRHNGSTVSGTASTYPTFTDGDIIMCAMDLDNQKLYFGKNGTWLDSSDPTSGATGTGSVADISATATWSPYVETKYGSDVVSVNYGNGYFRTTAISSEGTNASGIGKFEYDVPTGYTALSTKGLNE